MANKKNILILASGGGTNAEAIVKNAKERALPMHFEGGCNRKRESAGVYEKLESLNVPVHYLPSPKTDFSKVRDFLRNNEFDLIVLAGYMRVLPKDIADNYNILNIHPSILPFVYQGSEDAYRDALDNGDHYTGCTVHKVTSDVDAGERLGQVAFEIPYFINENGDIDALKAIGLAHEHALYIEVIKKVVFNAEKPLDMKGIAASAQKNLEDRGLPQANTIIPADNGSVFKDFNSKKFDASQYMLMRRGGVDNMSELEKERKSA